MKIIAPPNLVKAFEAYMVARNMPDFSAKDKATLAVFNEAQLCWKDSFVYMERIAATFIFYIQFLPTSKAKAFKISLLDKYAKETNGFSELTFWADLSKTND